MTHYLRQTAPYLISRAINQKGEGKRTINQTLRPKRRRKGPKAVLLAEIGHVKKGYVLTLL